LENVFIYIQQRFVQHVGNKSYCTDRLYQVVQISLEHGRLQTFKFYFYGTLLLRLKMMPSYPFFQETQSYSYE